MSFDTSQPKITSHAALRRHVYGGGPDDPYANKTVAAQDPNSVRFPPRMFVDKQNYLNAHTSSTNPMKEATWTIAETQGCASDEDIGSIHGRGFWDRLDEQEAQLSKIATFPAPVSRHLVELRQAIGRESNSRRKMRETIASARPQHRPVDIVPGLANYEAKEMAAAMMPGYVETHKPFNRRLHHEVAGARVLTVPKLYRDKADYMHLRYQMRARTAS